MTRRSMILMALVLIAAISMSTSVVAGSTYANIKAYLCSDHINTDQNPEARASIIINYVKGADEWIIIGRIWNAKPRTYSLGVGIGGESNVMIGQFTVGESGCAMFGFTATNLPEVIDIVRLYSPESTGWPGWPDLTAKEAGSLCSWLKFRGERRAGKD